MDPRVLVERKAEAQERIKTALTDLNLNYGLELATEGIFKKSADPEMSDMLLLEGYADFMESLLAHFERVASFHPTPTLSACGEGAKPKRKGNAAKVSGTRSGGKDANSSSLH
jgi:hypothetical protein